MRKSEKPDAIGIQITDRCNRKCSFCFNKRMRTSKRDMTLSEFKRIINGLKSAALNPEISISGGEPTLHDDHQAMVRYAVKKFGKGKVMLATNGSRIPASHSEAIKYLKSLDGAEVLVAADEERVKGQQNAQKIINLAIAASEIKHPITLVSISKRLERFGFDMPDHLAIGLMSALPENKHPDFDNRFNVMSGNNEGVQIVRQYFQDLAAGKEPTDAAMIHGGHPVFRNNPGITIHPDYRVRLDSSDLTDSPEYIIGDWKKQDMGHILGKALPAQRKRLQALMGYKNGKFTPTEESKEYAERILKQIQERVQD